MEERMKHYIFDIDPVAKPRMTQRDRWKKRDCVNNYYGFKDLIVLQANQKGLQSLPDSIEHLIFVIPMPESWSQKKKNEYEGSPHKQRPDLDNMLKSVQDCLCKEDKHIWQIKHLSKIWGKTGKILIGTKD